MDDADLRFHVDALKIPPDLLTRSDDDERRNSGLNQVYEFVVTMFGRKVSLQR